MSRSIDWNGEPVSPDEPPDAEIYVWEIKPHHDPSYDVLWVRSYHDLYDEIARVAEHLLDGAEKEELSAGKQIKIRLVKMRRSHFDEVTNE